MKEDIEELRANVERTEMAGLTFIATRAACARAALDYIAQLEQAGRAQRTTFTEGNSAAGQAGLAKIRDVLKEICDMQARNYGNGIDTHVELIALAKKGREALAAPVADTEREGFWTWEQRVEAAEAFLLPYADANGEKLLGDYHVQPIIRQLAAAILEWQKDAIKHAPEGCAEVAPVAAETEQAPDDLNGGMHASIFVKVWGDAGGGDAGRIALANYAYALGKRDALSAPAEDTEQATIDVSEMVNRFLGWKLPQDFHPDAGISFDRTYAEKWGMPIGTNLLAATQAKAMFEHCLKDAVRPTDDHLWNETLRDRDQYHEWADKLAEAIAKHFNAYIGEHSNMNCPWAEALDVIENAAPLATPADAGAELTEEEITEVVRRAIVDGKIIWAGFKKDASGHYTIPDLSPADFKLARAIEREVLARMSTPGAQVTASDAGGKANAECLLEEVAQLRQVIAGFAGGARQAASGDEVEMFLRWCDQVKLPIDAPDGSFSMRAFRWAKVAWLYRAALDNHSEELLDMAGQSPAPVTAEPARSIDTPEFCDLITELHAAHEEVSAEDSKKAWAALIAHIDRHIATHSAPADRDAIREWAATVCESERVTDNADDRINAAYNAGCDDCAKAIRALKSMERAAGAKGDQQ